MLHDTSLPLNEKLLKFYPSTLPQPDGTGDKTRPICKSNVKQRSLSKLIFLFRGVYIEVCRLKPRGGHLSMRKVHRHGTCGCVRMQEEPTLLVESAGGRGGDARRPMYPRWKTQTTQQTGYGPAAILAQPRTSFLHFKRTSPLIDYGGRIRLLSPLLTRVLFQPVRYREEICRSWRDMPNDF